MAYKTISGTISNDDYEYIQHLIAKGQYTGPTDVIRNAIKSLKTERGEKKTHDRPG